MVKVRKKTPAVSSLFLAIQEASSSVFIRLQVVNVLTESVSATEDLNPASSLVLHSKLGAARPCVGTHDESHPRECHEIAMALLAVLPIFSGI